MANPSGRPKGSQNKGTEALRKRIATLTERNYPALTEALEHVRADNPIKFVELYLKLLSYTLPQLQAIQQTLEVGDNTLSKITVEIKGVPSGSTDISK